MPHRLITLTALATGLTVAAVVATAAPALAKGPSQARITGPGLAHPVVLSGGGEPGQQGRLAVLAGQTGLFTVLFGPGGSVPEPARLAAAPPRAALGPRYTVVYLVPGVTPPPGGKTGQIRQEIYPRTPRGPLIYTPPGQHGFGQAAQLAGWTRGGRGLTRMLARLSTPGPGAHAVSAATPAPSPAAGMGLPGWLAVAAAGLALAALAGAAHWLRRRRRLGRA